MDNIVSFPGTKIVDDEIEKATVEDIMELASEANLKDIMIIGRTEDGGLFFTSTTGHAPSLLFDIESAKFIIMDSVFSSDF